MKITIAEEKGSGRFEELSFEKDRILFGRDALECDVAFDRERFPMVSRRHAELRCVAGNWLLSDLGSSYGTLLNGSRLAQPVPVAAGGTIQFGTDGPKVHIIWFDVAGGAEGEKSPAAPQPAVRSRPETAIREREIPTSLGPPEPERPPQTPAPAAEIPKTPPKLEFVNTAGREPFVIARSPVSVGRDPQCDIVFDASSATVSRRHADIRGQGGEWTLTDNNSFNGTLLNGQRIASPTVLKHGDEIQIGLGGPILRFNWPGRTAPTKGPIAAPTPERSEPERSATPEFSKTIVAKLDGGPARASIDASEPQLLNTYRLDGKTALTIGRDQRNDICLDGLQISNRHARLTVRGGEAMIEDLGSTNGTFVNGVRISRQTVEPLVPIQIGSFLLRYDPSAGVNVFDTRAKTRIDVVALTRDLKGRFGRGTLRLLDSVSFSIRPNEFVGLLGPSGAGKSTLIEAMAGARPATAGNVLVNNLDLYRHFDSLRQAIGYVPQDDIIHRELTVFRALNYVARLRLSRDVSSSEIRRMIDEVLDVTGLTDRRDVPVKDLSGGQRKRVSVAVELITKPQIICLDEPTTGLDPAAEDKMMQLFRQIAESGRTVIMTTHAMENVRLFDKIVLLMSGKLVYFGPPEGALKHFEVRDFRELYRKLEQAQDAAAEGSSADARSRAAESLRQRFASTPAFKEYVQEPLKELGGLEKTGPRRKSRLGLIGAAKQFFTLSRRYVDVLFRDKLTLFILFAQAPVIALLTFLVMGREQPRDFVYFVAALVAIWFGTSVAAREIIRERPIYIRERMLNLGIIPYLASKLLVLGVIVTLQCLMLFVPLKFFDLVGLMPMPGELAGIPQLWAMLLTAAVGVALGLFISAAVRTSEMATSLVPLILIPQILFSGLVGPPTGISKAAALTMPSAWAFDTMKRFSTLDTLQPEGADPRGPTKGLGLYKYIETENDKLIEKAKRDLEDYKRMGGPQFQDPAAGGSDPLGEKLAVPEMKRIPSDLSRYITFLHPWMNEVLNQLVLMIMFGILVFATLIILRLRDMN